MRENDGKNGCEKGKGEMVVHKFRANEMHSPVYVVLGRGITVVVHVHDVLCRVLEGSEVLV